MTSLHFKSNTPPVNNISVDINRKVFELFEEDSLNINDLDLSIELGIFRSIHLAEELLKCWLDRRSHLRIANEEKFNRMLNQKTCEVIKELGKHQALYSYSQQIKPSLKMFIDLLLEHYQEFSPPYLPGRKLWRDFSLTEDQLKKIKALRSKENDFFGRKRRDNYKSIVNCIRNVFEYNSKVVVIRLDLGYQSQTTTLQQRLDINKMKEQRDLFFKYLRKTYSKNCLGYVWKLEVGHRKGLHLHTLIFLDGQVHCHDVQIAKMLGEYWSTQITEGNGIYYNCNAVKKHYNNCCLGLVSYKDIDKENAFKQIANYLTKYDFLFQCNFGRKNRALGVMCKNKKISDKKIGRKRLEINSLFSLDG